MLLKDFFTSITLLFYFLTFLDKKERKVQASSLPDCVTQAGIGNILNSKFSYCELAFGIVIHSKGLTLETLLRVIRSFLKALNFSLHAHFHLVICEVKNKALEHSLSSNNWSCLY